MQQLLLQNVKYTLPGPTESDVVLMYIYACAQNPHIYYIYICSYIHIFLASMYLPTSYMYLHSSRSVHT